MDGCPGDEALLLAVAGRDMGAFRARYERHAGWLAVRLARRCNDRDLVADAVGDTFVARPGGVTLTVYRWALLVFLAAGVVQIFLAGLGAFKLLHGAGDPALDPHRMLGFAMAGAAIIILILTLIARPGARAIVGAVLLVLMTAFLQSLLAGLADDHVIFGALHATDGLLILAIPAYLYVWTGRRAA